MSDIQIDEAGRRILSKKVFEEHTIVCGGSSSGKTSYAVYELMRDMSEHFDRTRDHPSARRIQVQVFLDEAQVIDDENSEP